MKIVHPLSAATVAGMADVVVGYQTLVTEASGLRVGTAEGSSVPTTSEYPREAR